MDSQTAFKFNRLKGSSNYELWSIRMESYLIEKGYGDTIYDSARATRSTSTTATEVNEKATSSAKALALMR